jgi:hypothetical protein
MKRAESAQVLGYTHLMIGHVINDFKKQFHDAAKVTPLYAYEVYRTEDFKTKSPNGYTRGLFW